MTLESLMSLLGWVIILNFALLIIWFGFIACGRDWVYRVHRRWYEIEEKQFNQIHYSGMLHYKMLNLVLFVSPYLACRIVLS